MAIAPQNNEAFLREVDEELRRDQMSGLFQRWGLWIIGALVLALVVFAGVLYWRHHKEEVAAEQGERFNQAFQALAQNDVKTAAPILSDLAHSDGDGYRAMARFTQADIALQKNDLKDAANIFASIANDQSLAKPFRDLAVIRQTNAQYDSLTPQQVIDRLRPLAVKSSPWFGSAGEMVAVAYLQMNKRNEAGQLLAQIGNEPSVPDSIRQRAVQLAGVLGVDAVKNNEDGKAQ